MEARSGVSPDPSLRGRGAGSNEFWVDPERDVSSGFLSCGLMEDSYGIERHQRFADPVVAVLVG